MTAIVGNAGALKVGGNVVAELRNYSVEMTSDTIETSNMGDSTRQYVKGLSQFSGSADAYWDPTHFTTVDLDGLIFGSVGSTGTAVVFYPEGDVGSGTDKILSGTVIVTGYTINGSFDGMVEASISFQGTGALSWS